MNNVELENKITRVILEVGMVAHLKGYHYVREAIKITVLDKEVATSVTKILYPKVAQRFGTSTQKVERAIRTAIEFAWKWNQQGFQTYFGIKYWKSRPTNSEFIALVADKIRMEQKN